MGSRTDPLSTLRAAIQASRDEIRNGLAAFEAARGLREDKAVVARINTTRFAGHAANAIDRACTLDALMSAARLWDSGDCRVCRNILFQLQVGSVQKAIERLVVSRGHSAQQGQQRVSRLVQRVTMLENTAEPACQKLKGIRDSWLAHRDRKRSFAREGGATFSVIEFERLLRIAAVISAGVELVADGHSQRPSFRWEQASRRLDGAELWSLLVSNTTADRKPSTQARRPTP
jgi:hypothetical protein